mmetsp:Transcript_14511/g.31058  ORF Transcript_14511/g.31058 Transcript_14511/m.31058 type:complete len:274 (+) Transcript_14511:473-1294(+)
MSIRLNTSSKISGLWLVFLSMEPMEPIIFRSARTAPSSDALLTFPFFSLSIVWKTSRSRLSAADPLRDPCGGWRNSMSSRSSSLAVAKSTARWWSSFVHASSARRRLESCSADSAASNFSLSPMTMRGSFSSCAVSTILRTALACSAVALERSLCARTMARRSAVTSAAVASSTCARSTSTVCSPSNPAFSSSCTALPASSIFCWRVSREPEKFSTRRRSRRSSSASTAMHSWAPRIACLRRFSCSRCSSTARRRSSFALCGVGTATTAGGAP